jgi:hypothetical protein
MLMPLNIKASVVHVAPVFFSFLRVLVFCLIDIAWSEISLTSLLVVSLFYLNQLQVRRFFFILRNSYCLLWLDWIYSINVVIMLCLKDMLRVHEALTTTFFVSLCFYVSHELVAPWMKMFLTFSWTIYQVVANIMVEECFWIQIFIKPFLDRYCDKFSRLLLGFDIKSGEYKS